VYRNSKKLLLPAKIKPSGSTMSFFTLTELSDGYSEGK
jgi:hypothetical protein